MFSCAIILPNQLYKNSPLINLNIDTYFLVEEFLFFNQFKFHKQKIAYHIATMSFYVDYLQSLSKNVIYIKHNNNLSRIQNLLLHILNLGYKKLFIIDPVDNWIEKFISNCANKFNLEIIIVNNPGFILQKKDLKTVSEFIDSSYLVAKQTKFYIYMRKKLNVFVENGKPLGGKWSFDIQNRKKLPKNIIIPKNLTFQNKFWDNALIRVKSEFNDNPGKLEDFSFYPISFDEAKDAFDYFLENKILNFGYYQDFIDKDNNLLFHSNLSAAINIGLLTPDCLINLLIDFYLNNQAKISFNNIEGYLRQIIGWREYVRFIYEYFGTKQRNSNFFNSKNSNLNSFLGFNTGLYILDVVLKKLELYGYNHHIERLMVLANIMNLLRFNPNKVYEFFMSNYIDAYDWVMVPNVYGMGLFADGGLMSTKPYICSSNYLLKMSNFKKDIKWTSVVDSLYWRFIYDFKDIFINQNRMSYIVNLLDKIDIKKHLIISDEWIQRFK